MARICACDHEQSRHKLSKGGCRALDCYCAKFEGSGRTTDMADSAAVETVLPVIEIQPEPVADDGVPEEPRILNAAERGPQPIPPGWSPDGASTLARLAKAERERDTWRGNTDEQIALNQQLTNERDELAARLDAVCGNLDLRNGELVSANDQRDAARAETSEVRELLGGVLIERDSVRAAPAGTTLARYDRFFCQPITGCGKTAHQPDDDHECGPLIRATVTITHH
jgi:hypothetical protein